jgi:hypothetical protein
MEFAIVELQKPVVRVGNAGALVTQDRAGQEITLGYI